VAARATSPLSSGDLPSPSRAWVWPAIVVGLLAAHVTVWIGFASVAVNDPSFAVEPDYYRKALRWDETAAQLRANEALGWKVAIASAGTTSVLGERELRCSVSGRDGRPISGAHVELVTFHHARAEDRVALALREEPPGSGVYLGSPRMRKAGLWECRVTVRRGDETFTCVTLQAIPAIRGPGSALGSGGGPWKP
jgi:nitrogen fixation protein FixH